MPRTSLAAAFSLLTALLGLLTLGRVRWLKLPRVYPFFYTFLWLLFVVNVFSGFFRNYDGLRALSRLAIAVVAAIALVLLVMTLLASG